jgi:hypothetical protein
LIVLDCLSPFRRIPLVDFEYTAPAGERPKPLCCVVRDFISGQVDRYWLADDPPAHAPYDLGPRTLFVAYYASAELSCHLANGWPMPARILDLYAEFRRHTSGLSVPCGSGLLGALAYFGIDGLDAAEKEEMRQLAMRGGPYTPGEKEALLTYCQSDVDSLARLLDAMLPHIDLPRALFRGRYMAAAARMEGAGIPIDTETFTRLCGQWGSIKGQLVREVGKEYRVFVPAGYRSINPDSPFGSAILREAEEYGLDPYRLADTVDAVWREEREATTEVHEARRAARRETGLTARNINQWEDEGLDYSEWPGLDAKARELARVHPALGIGTGYTSNSEEDRTDYAGRLWDVLRENTDASKPKHHPDILRRAAEMLTELGVEDEYRGPMRFSSERWAAYLIRKGIPWPRLPTGELALDDETFREMARAYPAEVAPIRELRHTLSQLRLQDLSVGSDGRNRYMLSVFRAKTGRNQPSNTKAIFGPSAWIRSLIRPPEGRAVAYCDWSAQELAIAASLSGDRVMQAAYQSGDPYLFLARKAGAVPETATKTTHPTQREQFKVVSLGVLYGLSAEGLARRLSVPPCRGRELLQMHQETFRRFWEWSDQVEMEGMLTGRLQTVFGWTVHVGTDANPRSLRNFPMQGNGAEMMRLACCLATERGITVCAPVHDALLVEADAGDIDAVVVRTQEAMREASAIVLNGFEIRVDAKIVRWPDRYLDERGRTMWETVCRLLTESESAETDPLQNKAGTRRKMKHPAPYLIPSSPDRDIDSTPLPLFGGQFHG